jgi:hypothetical protein
MRDVQDAALPPSIALVVRIAPSRRLRALLLLAALAHAGAAMLLLSSGQNFALPRLCASACLGAAALCLAAALQRLNVRQIDISKAGTVHLTVQQKLPCNGRAVRLLPGSLLWGQLLVLRFGSAIGPPSPVQTVLVLPDSTGRESFRALAVAMRAIGGRNSAGADKKIA